MDLDLLSDLVQAFKEYQLSAAAGGQRTIYEFADWVKARQVPITNERAATDPLANFDIDVELGKLIIYLNRYARHLIRKGLSEFPQLANEDYTYLYILMGEGEMTKKQLIERNIHEKAGGLEVIKRLLKHNLICEKTDDKDKRSKLVSLTDAGRQMFFQTLEQMGKVSKLIAGDLSAAEKESLLELLKKLEDFHNPLFLRERKKTIDELSMKTSASK
jgi:DNA-binding MarR family transcriptional regulator